MIGFIYIWRDRKHNRYYVGAHWGTEDDGYVCSSSWMKRAYEKRPEDFKRRILERFTDRSKSDEIEHRWLQMIKPEELKGLRYYNFNNFRFGHWSSDERSRMTVGQKISKSKTGKSRSQETRDRISATRIRNKCPGWQKGVIPWNKGKSTPQEIRDKISRAKMINSQKETPHERQEADQ